MRAQDIVNQLFNVLPKYTNLFTDNLSVTSLTRSGTTVTAVTATNHGLTTDKYAFIFGARNPISISSLTQVGGVATAVTSEDHDLSLNAEDVRLGYECFIDISGANEADYNGSHKLLSVANRREFTYEIVDTAPATATGTPILEQDGIGYNGRHQVTVIDPTTFTFATTFTPNSPAVGTIEARLGARIAGIIAGEQIVEVYTKQPNNILWAFVATGDRVANKDREILSDATYTSGNGVDYRQLVIQPFSVYCVIPTTASLKARAERDLADDLVLPFCKSLLDLKFPVGFAEDPYSGVVYSTDRFYRYDGAIYIHEYSFQTTAWITYSDTIDPEISYPFRDIELDFGTSLNESAGIVMEAKVDLDEDQLT